MVLKFLKWTAILSLGIVVLFAGWIYLEFQRYQRGEYPFVDRSTVETSGMKITLERFSTHLYLAEYKRFLIIEREGSAAERTEIMMDTGGMAAVDICETRNGLMFVDRLNIYTVSNTGAVVSQNVKDDCIKSVGGFGRVDKGPYGFQQAGT